MEAKFLISGDRAISVQLGDKILLSAVNEKYRMPVNKAFPVLFYCINIEKVAKRWQIIKL